MIHCYTIVHMVFWFIRWALEGKDSFRIYCTGRSIFYKKTSCVFRVSDSEVDILDHLIIWLVEFVTSYYLTFRHFLCYFELPHRGITTRLLLCVPTSLATYPNPTTKASSFLRSSTKPAHSDLWYRDGLGRNEYHAVVLCIFLINI